MKPVICHLTVDGATPLVNGNKSKNEAKFFERSIGFAFERTVEKTIEEVPRGAKLDSGITLLVYYKQ
jgi:hypothetical protein